MKTAIEAWDETRRLYCLEDTREVRLAFLLGGAWFMDEISECVGNHDDIGDEIVRLSFSMFEASGLLVGASQ